MGSEGRKLFNNQVFSVHDSAKDLMNTTSVQTDILGDNHFIQMDVYEKGDSLVAELDIPGINISEIKVSVQKEWLIVEGVKKETSPSKKANYLQIERNFGAIKRTLKLEIPIDANGVTAKYRNGVLKITLPKRSERRNRARHIQIEEGS